MRQMYITIIISESDTLVYFVNFNFHTLFYSTFFMLLNKMNALWKNDDEIRIL